MKSFLCIASLIISVNGFSQKIINEGVLTYNISIESVNGEKQVSGALNGAVLTLFLTKDKSRTEMVSTLGTETTVYDTKAAKGYILKEYSGQKLMITATAQNWEQKNRINSNLTFKTSADNSVINGYSCKKATATTAEGKNYTVYYDPTIVVTNKTYNNAFPQLVGMPIQYESQSGNLVFKYSLSKYNTDLQMPNKFDAPKAGYRVMSYEENQQLKKGE